MRRDEERFIESIKQQLDQQSDTLDGRTLSQLRQVRTKAMAEDRITPWRRPSLAAFASVTVLAVAVWLALPVNNGGEQNMAALDDIELLAAADDLEFYENIEFYQWVESQDEQG
ncbi:MAG: hypothetical protein FD130_50 [Halothiobacillaceae bacterium]|nr:MAG: hypothetical protein FD130_50 [Halothiobacillaceae bacterium]